MEPWGADSSLTSSTTMEIAQEKELVSRTVCISMIHFFQKHISPIDGPRSHFYPTSSQYALNAIEKYGVLKGIALGCDRLLRENTSSWVYPLKDNRKFDPVR